jgi:hypothetical protein
MRVTNAIHFGCSLLLPVGTVNCTQTLKAHAVFNNRLSQTLLPPSLLKIYVAVDMIEGLDVDKEDFEKYAVKSDVLRLLERIWTIRGHRDSIVAASNTPEFADFMLAFTENSAFTFVRCSFLW